ncbi:MAG TPA: GNAT family N-acetyltransferase [Solirubrobacterales bacterium]|nr:GNAT family N-acetyltransferase [Solirubrobacterales bacterium]
MNGEPLAAQGGEKTAGAAAWHVRVATAADVPAAADAVGELLTELGGQRPGTAELEEEARALVEDPALGVLLVAEAGGELLGVLAASHVRALHVPGRYLVIQDLWVRPDWRSRTIGADLLAAIAEVARQQGLPRIEVGLPQETFAGIRATEAFYLGNGFVSLGIRMRRRL